MFPLYVYHKYFVWQMQSILREVHCILNTSQLSIHQKQLLKSFQMGRKQPLAQESRDQDDNLFIGLDTESIVLFE